LKGIYKAIAVNIKSFSKPYEYGSWIDISNNHHDKDQNCKYQSDFFTKVMMSVTFAFFISRRTLMSYTELLSAYFSKGEPVNDLTKTLIFDS
jgi:hypothetical protein